MSSFFLLTSSIDQVFDIFDIWQIISLMSDLMSDHVSDLVSEQIFIFFKFFKFFKILLFNIF